MSETPRTKEVVEKELQETRVALDALVKKLNDQWYQEEWDKEKLEELEKTEEELKKELDGLMGRVSSASHKKNTVNEKLEMTYEEALSYLWEIKDYTWNQLLQEDRKWIMAVQIVLKNRWYDEVWKIDWYYGKRTKAWVKNFQEAAGFTWEDLDWLPWSKTINAILWNWWGDKWSVKTEVKDDTGDVKTETDGWRTYTWTYKADGTPNNGVFEKDGKKYEVKDGELWDEIK